MPVSAKTLVCLSALCLAALSAVGQPLRLNALEYFERPGVNVMAFQDIYPEGHQGGVSIIQHGVRVATNGDLRLEPTPGQWQPVPLQHARVVDQAAGVITTRLSYPDSSRHLKGFNPMFYPDLYLSYQVRVAADGEGFRIVVDLDRPLPAEWVGKVGFNLELYPTDLFGKSWRLGEAWGIFPRQANGPVTRDAEGVMQAAPLAVGRRLMVAPETDLQRLEIESLTGDLMLLDGRHKHNNGWFVVRSLVGAGATRGAVEWRVRPHAAPGWKAAPVVHVSQVGYHPAQEKIAHIELDAADEADGAARLLRVSETGGLEEVGGLQTTEWGRFLRYRYRRLDFSAVRRPGMYVVEYEGRRSEPFRIADDVFAHAVWQPVVDYFYPAQMCHMRIIEQYRVWHGACHLDDARMAPTGINHFDGYLQGPSTLTRFRPGERVPGLNRGGWHDAGDDDFRIESQAAEVHLLAAAYEAFANDYDNTTIRQDSGVVRIHQPDGKPDFLQQIEHGVLTILGGYESLGRLYRGIIVPTLDQYVLLGDVANVTDNLAYDPRLGPTERAGSASGLPDDRWVFTEEHAGHEYEGIMALAIAGRVLRAYDPDLARRSLAAAEALYAMPRDTARAFDGRIAALTELYLTTRAPRYRQALLEAGPRITARIGQTGWAVGRALPLLDDAALTAAVREAVARHFAGVEEAQRKTPFGVPYEPVIWGAGWGIQRFGVEQYFLHRAFPDLVSTRYLLNALNFVLGAHPGENTASFASGVGARSMTTAYGFNRADWSYIPGGVVSGTALIRPDFAEMKNFPYLWQQAEYVMGGGSGNYLFLALAADQVLREQAAAK